MISVEFSKPGQPGRSLRERIGVEATEGLEIQSEYNFYSILFSRGSSLLCLCLLTACIGSHLGCVRVGHGSFTSFAGWS